jgi:hypothetical protein
LLDDDCIDQILKKILIAQHFTHDSLSGLLWQSPKSCQKDLGCCLYGSHGKHLLSLFCKLYQMVKQFQVPNTAPLSTGWYRRRPVPFQPADKILVRSGRFPEETKDLPLALGGAFQAFDILGVNVGHVNLIPRI